MTAREVVSSTETPVQAGEVMIEGQARVEQFKQEIADMKVRDPATARDRLFLRTGVAMMVVGIALTVVAYVMSYGADTTFNTEGPAEQRDAIIIALMGVATAVVGAALFLRYSIANFLRFWLARLIYEQQSQTDRVVAATRPPDA